MRRNHLHPEPRQRDVQGICVIGAVTNEPLRQVVYEAGIEGRCDERTLVRRSRGGTRGVRKTQTVCHCRHCHELRTFAPLGRSHAAAPFFATTKVPSIKHSLRSSLPRTLRSWASASKSRSNVPARVQRWKRR